MPRSHSHFDRLAGVRRNRRFRNIATIICGASLMLGVVLYVDPMVSGALPNDGWVAFFGIVFLLSFAMAIYFHLRFLSRE